MRQLIVIPARYESTRLKHKLTKELGGNLTVLQNAISQTLEAALTAFGTGFKVVVAVDDKKLKDLITLDLPNLDVVMTSKDHINGTSRVSEVVQMEQYKHYETVTIVSGDEVFVHPETLVSLYLNLIEAEISTVLVPNFDEAQGADHDVVKASYNYFTKEIITMHRDPVSNAQEGFYEHVGIYSYRTEALLRLMKQPDTPMMLERSIELLKALESGFNVTAYIDESLYYNVNNNEDLKKAKELIKFLKDGE
jgi:3-deoxy-manno-octulosonate cytidylyltransferase (CMP-KDO synthetase)